jgi:hypothetical protein
MDLGFEEQGGVEASSQHLLLRWVITLQNSSQHFENNNAAKKG